MIPDIEIFNSAESLSVAGERSAEPTGGRETVNPPVRPLADIEPIKRQCVEVPTREEFEREFQAKYGEMNISELVEKLADEDDALASQGGAS